MLKIGITGGIGSGKTTVCRLFELLGIPVYSADEESKQLLQEDKDVLKKILDFFGKDVLDKEGKPDRKKLAAIVFNDKVKLEALNAIMHPAVAKHFENWVQKHKNAAYVLKEAAIMFESGAHTQVDKVITVNAPMELRIARTMKRDNIQRTEVESRMKSQMSDEERTSRSQYSISNDEQTLLIPQVLELNRLLTADK